MAASTILAGRAFRVLSCFLLFIGVFSLPRRNTLYDRNVEEDTNNLGTELKSKLDFSKDVYNGYILENSKIGSGVSGLEDLLLMLPFISLEDRDSTDLALSGDGSKHFILSNTNCESGMAIHFLTTHILDSKLKNSYHFTLTAPKLGLSTEVHIVVLDQNDNRPKFTQPIYELEIYTSTPTDMIIGSVHADTNNNNGIISYSLEENDYFRVDHTNGAISLVKAVPSGIYSLVVHVVDAGNPLLEGLGAIIRVTVSDESLIFRPYLNDMIIPESKSRRRRDVLPGVTATVNESAPTGFVVYMFNGTSSYHYMITDNNPRFEVDYNEGIVRVRSPLDFEMVNTETITIVAWDSQASMTYNSTSLTINIQDVDEPPMWTMEYEPYIAVLMQDVANGVSVYQLSAVDPDDTSTEIQYEFFIDTAGDVFNVDETTGEVFTNFATGQSLVGVDEIVLTVAAREKGTDMASYADIQIVIGTRPPQFTREIYNVEVTEGSSPRTLLEVKAKSFERTGTIAYSIVEQAQGISHSIDNEGVITLNSIVDREVREGYKLRIRAEDKIGSGYCEVYVTIVDVNDHMPEFSQVIYAFNDISEDILLTTWVGRVAVEDDDGEVYGKVLYTTPNDVPFWVSENGYVYPSSPLNYEIEYNRYEFVVTATDLGGLSSHATIRVYMTNVNDASPVFSQQTYSFQVDENAPANYKINNVYATDPDGDGLTFTIKREGVGYERFQVDTYTGVVSRSSITETLTEASYTITIVATDNGACCSKTPPEINEAEATVVIVINDINDNTPIFPDCNTYKPVVVENGERISVVLDVVATDEDKGSNGEVTYRLKKKKVPTATLR